MNKEELQDFEKEIADLFNSGKIRSPVHLSGGNEEHLITYFTESFSEGDWICSTWRSHYHCLLAGVPPAKLKNAILAGRSITLCFPEHKFFSSAIVGGNLSIALGIAKGIKLSGGKEKVHCFIGDMAARTGITCEVGDYAYGHGLPLCIIIEDNNKSVCTDTYEVWKSPMLRPWVAYRYYYKLTWPHSGAGKRVEF